ncbi:MAG: YraN family protein [Oscillospiraceae bacterium]|jgi:putative endonuclease|nr:YraN family protein [Oscillospiraceae bacterium]
MSENGAPGAGREKPSGAKSRGDMGESLALEYLTRRGYVPVCRGYRTRYGEIDLIMRDGRYIVFVEVKLRKSDAFAQAREFVGRSKQQKLRATAMIWLASHETALQPRFDVVEVYARDGAGAPPPRINHIENAFA